MRYQVPQFIEVEDKIIGSLTIKQFLYLAGFGAFGFILFTLLSSILPRMVSFLLCVPVIGFGFMLAFYQVNGKPFIFVVENSVKFFFGPKLYLWKKEAKKPKAGERASDNVGNAYDQLYVPRMSDSKLRDLTWSLDIHDSVSGEQAPAPLETKKGIDLKF